MQLLHDHQCAGTQVAVARRRRRRAAGAHQPGAGWRAGCKRVFIGLENINSDNLLQAKKKQNRVHEHRQMFLAWRAQRIITYAGYILGFPGDTPERIARDIRTVQQELPVDLLEFFILTPLPGSADHQSLHQDGVWMDPDMTGAAA
jgi:hypothetical protein